MFACQIKSGGTGCISDQHLPSLRRAVRRREGTGVGSKGKGLFILIKTVQRK
jgi:hypothetical protein